jgi:predicted metal-dependent phosphoesterase TrpH
MPSIFDLHVHTSQGSRDSALTPEEMITEAARIGLDGVLLAEHEGWPRHQFDIWNAQRDDPLVVVRALEVYTNWGHVIVLGMDGHESGVFDIEELARVVDRIGGYMMIAHPFRFLFDPAGQYTRNILFQEKRLVPATPEEAAEHRVFRLVHNLEVVNGGNIEPENQFARQVAAVLGFSGSGGSDAHSTQGFGRGVTIFDDTISHQRDLIEALRAGACHPAEGFNVGRVTPYRTQDASAAG